MRSSAHIQSLWEQGGPFVGPDGKPNTVVTAQLPWPDETSNVGDVNHVLQKGTPAGYSKRGLPVRWFQRQDQSQVERIIPNVQSVSVDESIDADAASCTVTLTNQWMRDNDDQRGLTASEFGEHGYFGFDHGVTADSQARWKYVPNEWANVLIPNTIIRTYTGFGGHDKDLETAVADGNLILKGVWLIDEVQVGSSGSLTIQCRNMAKLLINQQLYPPLVPSAKYPLTYYRWSVDSKKVAAASTTSVTTGIKTGVKRIRYEDSAVDHWYGGAGANTTLHGHKGSDSVDGNTATYALSVGNSGPDKPFATNWWQYLCGETINAVYVHPWAGNYELYVSVMENGKWQGSQTVPYDHSSLIGRQPHVVDTGADIPYVAKFTTPWEEGREYVLPRAYNAERVRISTRHLTYSGIGQWPYRSGLREVQLRASNKGTGVTTSSTVAPIFFAAATIRNPDNLNTIGYLTSSHTGQIDVFGDARTKPFNTDSDKPSGAAVLSVVFTDAADGYWVLRQDGRISTYGAASYFGSRVGGDNAGQILPTPSEQGYWVVHFDGTIRAFGDATDYPDFMVPSGERLVSVAGHPTSQGLAGLVTNGTVGVRGAATHYGNASGRGYRHDANVAASHLAYTMDGTGYWVLATSGEVTAFGSADDHGQPFQLITEPERAFYDSYSELLPTPSDGGYHLLKGNGEIDTFGDAEYFGAPIPGSQAQLRKPGNYTDYTDIIRDLALWAGFWFHEDSPGNSDPDVYGALESTGSYSDLPLPDDLFDKRPVIDAMTELKEAVGYLLWVDDEGRIRFESPNWWTQGNFGEDGAHTDHIPEIDEQVQLISHSASRNDESLRSTIIISSEDPDDALEGTITTRYRPQTAQGLRGLIVPAMWVNNFFQDKEEQETMAELISVHIWFAQRLSQTTAVFNPLLQINDQVRIYERTTGETYIHYVRGLNWTHDLESGEYTMNLTTHWLGDGESWAIDVSNDWELAAGANESNPDTYTTSPRLTNWLHESPSRSTWYVAPENTSGRVTYLFPDPRESVGSDQTASNASGGARGDGMGVALSPAFWTDHNEADRFAALADIANLGVKWVRFGIGNTPTHRAVVDQAHSLGLQVLGLVRAPGTSTLDQVYLRAAAAAATGVDAIEIGDSLNWRGTNLKDPSYLDSVARTQAALNALDDVGYGGLVISNGLAPFTDATDYSAGDKGNAKVWVLGGFDEVSGTTVTGYTNEWSTGIVHRTGLHPYNGGDRVDAASPDPESGWELMEDLFAAGERVWATEFGYLEADVGSVANQIEYTRVALVDFTSNHPDEVIFVRTWFDDGSGFGVSDDGAFTSMIETVARDDSTEFDTDIPESAVLVGGNEITVNDDIVTLGS